MVRSTASGQTCAIDPGGKIIAMAPPFSEAWINTAIPLVKRETLYTRYGDYLGFAFAFAAVVLLLFGAVLDTIRKAREE
jgi:apolipoprotein N-acyltransferase